MLIGPIPHRMAAMQCQRNTAIIPYERPGDKELEENNKDYEGARLPLIRGQSAKLAPPQQKRERG